MLQRWGWGRLFPAVLGSLIVVAGCQNGRTSRQAVSMVAEESVTTATQQPANANTAGPHRVQLTAFESASDQNQLAAGTDVPAAEKLSPDSEVPVRADSPEEVPDDLLELVALAQSRNPRLVRLEQEANAAGARTRYINQLPDPTFGANVFGQAIETAAGAQRANLTLTQMIPWLDRLDAQQQQACFQAMALRQKYAAERLRVIGDIRAGYYRLYILTRQIEAIRGDQELLQNLIAIQNSRVLTALATQRDVLLGTLELGRLEEQGITLQKQLAATEIALNRLASRPTDTPISVPAALKLTDSGWTHEMLMQTALERQPVIAAATLQAHAARWGVNVAELRRRPDLQIGAAWFFMDDNRPASSVVDVGRDAWSVGASVTVPLNGRKYDAIRDEALWANAAANATIEETRDEFDARLRDLLQQSHAALETASLFENTILPQAMQTLQTDQEALTNGTVEFDRVLQDFRDLLTVQFGYHRAVGEVAIATARIQQAVGVDLPPVNDSTSN
jgi:cobalt-zinc-cadmium efflux system outer membrane protein